MRGTSIAHRAGAGRLTRRDEARFSPRAYDRELAFTDTRFQTRAPKQKAFGYLDPSEDAGEAIAAVPSATAVDAIVMASAAQRGDVVYTSDFEDLERLRQRFPSVRVLRV